VLFCGALQLTASVYQSARLSYYFGCALVVCRHLMKIIIIRNNYDVNGFLNGDRMEMIDSFVGDDVIDE